MGVWRARASFRIEAANKSLERVRSGAVSWRFEGFGPPASLSFAVSLTLVGMKRTPSFRTLAKYGVGLSAVFVVAFLLAMSHHQPLLRVGANEHDFSQYIYNQTECAKRSHLSKVHFFVRWVDQSHAETYRMYNCGNRNLLFRFQQVEFTNGVVVNLKRARWRVFGFLVN